MYTGMTTKFENLKVLKIFFVQDRFYTKLIWQYKSGHLETPFQGSFSISLKWYRFSSKADSDFQILFEDTFHGLLNEIHMYHNLLSDNLLQISIYNILQIYSS